MSDNPMYPDSPEESVSSGNETEHNENNRQYEEAPRQPRPPYGQRGPEQSAGNYPPPSGGSYRGTYGNNYGDPYENQYSRTYAGNYGNYNENNYARPAPGGNEPPRKQKPPKKSGSHKNMGWIIAVVAICCVLVGGGVGGLLTGLVIKNQNPAAPAESVSTVPETSAPAPQPELVKKPQASAPADETKPAERPTFPQEEAIPLEELYKQAVPSIVGVTNEATTEYFGRPSTSVATGTGFIISPDGEILTNYHVAGGADKLTVTLCDGTKYEAELLGYEAESDVALLKIDAENLPAVTLGDSDNLLVGDQIAAIGNPLGELTYTMTVGYVSAKGRAVRTEGNPINMMQIDAAINPGNSGGPLFNVQGQVVGITTAKYSGMINGGATIEGIGFAIPINDVLAILDEIREFGTVQNRAYLGVRVQNSTNEEVPGAEIASVEDGLSAAEAGLQAGDIITGVEDRRITSNDDLYQALREYRAGDTAKITLWRDGDTYEAQVTFGARPEEPAPQETVPEETEDPFYFPWEFIFP